ncbi:uncharacterized protein LOC110422878 [Herrania umbratica]|uniref:Uncharacterized protein LOC110422878 n=1 Tax=Herrania umbratica TaxID=108875 RepID=A0A6J1B0A4_9ROSI|nr:uncharacterized protein LOC110422878 [Herrania umbratica]
MKPPPLPPLIITWKTASHVCGISLTDNVVEIIFHVFDSNRDGHSTADEFFRVSLKTERDVPQPVKSGILGLLSCCWNCSNNISIWRLWNVLVSGSWENGCWSTYPDKRERGGNTTRGVHGGNRLDKFPLVLISGSSRTYKLSLQW